MYYLQLAINGLIAGSVYALFAVGLTMVYGVFRFINFAHGDLIAWGAYGVLLFTSTLFHLPMPVAIILSLILTIFIGLGCDRFVYNPLRYSDRITLLIASIGLSFFLRSALQLCFGADLLSYNMKLNRGFFIGGISITRIQLAMAASSILFLGSLYLILTKTLIGKALRAVSDSLELATIMGLPMRRVNIIVWALASLFAGVGGILLAMDTNLDPYMGMINLIKAFAAVLIGGAGNVWGALIGGLFIGVAEQMSIAFVSPGYKEFVAFAVIIFMLLFKPRGIFSMGKEGVR